MANSASTNSLPLCDSNSSSNRNSVISDTYEVPPNDPVDNGVDENKEDNTVNINIIKNNENEINVLSQQNNNSKTATTNNKGERVSEIWKLGFFFAQQVAFYAPSFKKVELLPCPSIHPFFRLA